MNLSPQHVAFVVSVAVGIGVLLPLLQAAIQKPHWSPRTKAILTVVLAIIGGIAGYVVDHGLDFSDPSKLAIWIFGVYGAATTLYARLLKPTGATDAIEHNVNGGGSQVVGDAPDGPADPADTPVEPAITGEGV